MKPLILFFAGCKRDTDGRYQSTTDLHASPSKIEEVTSKLIFLFLFEILF